MHCATRSKADPVDGERAPRVASRAGRRARVLGATALIVFISPMAVSPLASAAGPEIVRSFTAPVSEVVAADVLAAVDGDETVTLRLDGIIAPAEGEPQFEEARDAVSELLADMDLLFEVLDAEREGMPLARVWHRGRSVNKRIVEQGWARHDAESRPSTSMATAQAAAEAAGRGIWGSPPAGDSPDADAAEMVELTDAEREAILAVAEGFLAASAANDMETAKTFATTKARESLDEMSGPDDGGERSFELGEVSIADGIATVEATLTEDGEDEPGKVLLKREEGEWRVFAIAMVLGEDGPEMTLNFENMEEGLGGLVQGIAEGMAEGLSEAFQGGLGGGEPAAPITAMTAAEYEQTWRTEAGYDGVPAGQALAEVAEEIGLEIDASDIDDQLDAEVTVPARPRSRLELIEAICEQARCYPQYEGNTLHFRGGQRELPVTFQGPFLLEVLSVDQFVPYATGTMEVVARAQSLPAPIGQATELESYGSTLTIFEARHESGNSLIDEEQTMNFGNFSMSFGEEPEVPVLYEQSLTVGLKNLVKNVAEVSELFGSVDLIAPAEVQTVLIETLEPGAKQTVADMEIEVTQATLDEPASVEVAVRSDTDLEDAILQLVPLDAAGEPMPTFGTSSYGFGGEMNVSVNCESAPAAVSLQIVTDVEPLSYEFELAGVPLDDHDQMPAEIEELDFGAEEAPIACEFIEIGGEEGFRTVLVDATNHANKDLRELHVQLKFLDDAGEVLDDSSTMHSGDSGFDVGPPVAIRAGQSEQIELTAFFMPEETKSVNIRVERAVFCDATSWEADQ